MVFCCLSLCSFFVKLVVLCSYYRCSFDPNNGGEMEQLEFERYMKPDEAEETVSI